MALTKEQKLKKLQLLRQKAIIQSKTSFWAFCKTIAPDFYKEDRTYLKDLCNTLQNIYEQKLINPKTNKPYKNLALSIPPRHGKSRTVGLFTAWCVGVNKQNKIMTASYNEDIGTTFSRNCRDLMFTPKSDEFETVFSEIFPDIAIKKGNSAVNNWTVEGGYNTYYGGGLFAQRIRDILVRDYDTNKIVIKEEVQTRNKQTRILVTAPWIQEHIFFPINAKHRWKEAWEHIITFSKSGKNSHDDIEDCLTALAENFGQGIKKEKKLRSIRLPGI